MEMISLREYIDMRFEDHREHVDRQFEDLKEQIKANRDHSHSDKVGWAPFVLIVLTVLGLILGVQ